MKTLSFADLPAPTQRRVEQWPALDRTAFMDAVAKGELGQPSREKYTRGDRVRARHNVRPRTIASYIDSYTRALQWLENEGAMDQRASPASRWPKQRLQAYVHYLMGHASEAPTDLQPEGVRFKATTAQARFVGLYRTLAIVDPTTDEPLMRSFARALPRPPRPPQELPIKLEQIKFLSQILMREADCEWDDGNRKPSVAMRFMTGLQLHFLHRFGLRLKNLMGIKGDWQDLSGSPSTGRVPPDYNFHRDQAGWSLKISALDGKNRRGITKRLNAEDLELLVRFVQRYRPELISGTYGDRSKAVLNGELWVSSRGTPQTDNSAYKCMRKHAERVLGLEFHPHQARRAIATDMIRHDPNTLEEIATKLNNSKPIVERHYIRGGAKQGADVARALLRQKR